MITSGRIGATIGMDLALEFIKILEWSNPVYTLAVISLLDTAFNHMQTFAFVAFPGILIWHMPHILGYLRHVTRAKSAFDELFSLTSNSDALIQIGKYFMARHVVEIEFIRQGSKRIANLNPPQRILLISGLALFCWLEWSRPAVEFVLVYLLFLKDTEMAKYYTKLIQRATIYAHVIYIVCIGQYSLPPLKLSTGESDEIVVLSVKIIETETSGEEFRLTDESGQCVFSLQQVKDLSEFLNRFQLISPVWSQVSPNSRQRIWHWRQEFNNTSKDQGRLHHLLAHILKLRQGRGS